MLFKYPCIFPIGQGILFPATFVTTYTVSVINKDIPAVFPYVSDTGVWGVQRCFFTFMMGFGSLLIFMVMYIRYRQVKEVLESDADGTISMARFLGILNKISIYLVFLAAIGLYVLGCFQVWPYFYMHLIGAGTCFTFGWITLAIQMFWLFGIEDDDRKNEIYKNPHWLALQAVYTGIYSMTRKTYISYMIYPIVGTKWMNCLRAILVLILGATLLITSIVGMVAMHYFEGDNITRWTKSSGGYKLHLISTISEWIAILGFVLYLALYTWEFKSIVMYRPKLELVNT